MKCKPFCPVAWYIPLVAHVLTNSRSNKLLCECRDFISEICECQLNVNTATSGIELIFPLATDVSAKSLIERGFIQTDTFSRYIWESTRFNAYVYFSGVSNWFSRKVGLFEPNSYAYYCRSTQLPRIYYDYDF